MPKKVKVRKDDVREEQQEERVEYWVERERVWSEVKEEKGKKGLWRDVEEIFVDEPEVVRRLL